MNTYFCLLLALSTALLHSAAFAQNRFRPSADAAQVTDSRTGLIWQRCVQGMQFKGKTCTGEALFLTYPATLSHVEEEVKRTGVAWRLPTMKELSAIASAREADESGGQAAIDAAAFPATPLGRYWSSTSVGPHYYMYVSFTDASVGEGRRNAVGAIRLVRQVP